MQGCCVTGAIPPAQLLSGLFSFCTTSSLIIFLLFLICSCLMPPTEGPASTAGSTHTITVTTTKAPAKRTTGTKRGLSGEPSPSYKRKILDISQVFSVFTLFIACCIKVLLIYRLSVLFNLCVCRFSCLCD